MAKVIESYVPTNLGTPLKLKLQRTTKVIEIYRQGESA
jgi:hypothetical protein